MVGEFTFFDLFAGAGGMGLAFRTAGFCCDGVLETSPVSCSSCRMNIPFGEDPPVVALGSKANLKPESILKRLGGRSPEVLTIQPNWPPARTKQGKPRKPVFLSAPHDWFGDPRNRNMDKVFSFIKTLTPRVVVLSHIKNAMDRRDLGLIGLHCTALRCMGYTALPVQINDAWYGGSRSRYRVIILAARDMKLSDLALYWPPDRLFRDRRKEPNWVRTNRRVQSLLDTWYPLAPPQRSALPLAPSLVETLEDLPPAPLPWMGGAAPLDTSMDYLHQPWGWFARQMRNWIPDQGDDLKMHVCLPPAWLDSNDNEEIHTGWLHDLQARQGAMLAQQKGQSPKPWNLHIPLPDPGLLDQDELTENGEPLWLQMPSPPVAGTPPLLWQDRFLRIYSGGSPQRSFSLREKARFATFPDGWNFAGSFPERLKQMDEAMPPLVGLVIARTVRAILEGSPPEKCLLPECPAAPAPRPPAERRRLEGSRGRMGELPFS